MINTMIHKAPSDATLVEAVRPIFASIPELASFTALENEIDLYSIGVVLRSRHQIEFGPVLFRISRDPEETLEPFACMRLHWPDVATLIWGYIANRTPGAVGYWMIQITTPDNEVNEGEPLPDAPLEPLTEKVV